MHLVHAIGSVQRDVQTPDAFSWPCDKSGVYTARSTYQRLCTGLERVPFAKCIWRSWAPLRCKIFAWLAAQRRLWTSDRRARHGLQDHPSPCFICLQDQDNIEHILIQCVYAREVWYLGLQELNIQIRTPEPQDTLTEWWLWARGHFRRAERRGFDTLVIITTWALWKQRNARVFNRPWQIMNPTQLLGQIGKEVQDLRTAGIGVGGLQRFVRQ